MSGRRACSSSGWRRSRVTRSSARRRSSSSGMTRRSSPGFSGNASHRPALSLPLRFVAGSLDALDVAGLRDVPRARLLTAYERVRPLSEKERRHLRAFEALPLIEWITRRRREGTVKSRRELRRWGPATMNRLAELQSLAAQYCP